VSAQYGLAMKVSSTGSHAPASFWISTTMREALSPGWYSWMQPTYVGTKKSTAIHTSQSVWYVELPDEHAELLFWRPRHALEIPAESSVPGSPSKAFRGPLTLHRLHRVGDSVHSVPDAVKPASTVAFSTIAVVCSQVLLLMKRAEKMLHSFLLLYRAGAGALNRQRCAVAPLRGGGGGGVRGGCGGGGTFAATSATSIPIREHRESAGILDELCVLLEGRRPTRSNGSRPNTESPSPSSFFLFT
jgi:hypothetical protein